MEEKTVSITEDEKAWVKALATGKKTDDVAAEFDMVPGTFAYKLNVLRSKLGCKNTVELVAYFFSNKLIQ